MRGIVILALSCLLVPLAVGAEESASAVFTESILVTGEAPHLTPVDLSQRVVISFKIGALKIETADVSEVRTELILGCRSMSPEQCERYADRLRLTSEQKEDEVVVRLSGLSRWQTRRLDVEGKVVVPRWAPLEVQMGIGDLEIHTAAEKDLRVGMKIGELTIHAPKQRVATLDLDAGIGDAWIRGAGVDISGDRKRLIGAEADWATTEGAIHIDARLGIGDLGVILE